jgi:hypothetical protein
MQQVKRHVFALARGMDADRNRPLAQMTRRQYHEGACPYVNKEAAGEIYLVDDASDPWSTPLHQLSKTFCASIKTRLLSRAFHTCILVAYHSHSFATQPNRCIHYHGILVALVRLPERSVTHGNLLSKITAGEHMALLHEL